MSFIKKRYYFYNFFKSQSSIPPFYGSIAIKPSQTVLYDSLDKDFEENQSTYKVNHTPDYLYIKYNHENSFKIKTVSRHIGYAVDLSQYSDIGAYVTHHFKNARKIKRYVSKLETCFNISYKRYYGDISRDVYEDLLNRLYTMVEKRFCLLNDTNQQINDTIRWQTTLDETYSLIREKRASLFVIYEDNKPILINIAHHWGTIFYDFMFSFDIDYSKFSLGHISFYKQIEWCINEGYEIFDTGPGEYHYKKRWSNQSYNLLQHVIYKKSNVKSVVLGNVEVALTLIKKYSEHFSIKPYIKLKKKRMAKKNDKKPTYKMACMKTNDFNLDNYQEIDYEINEYSFLRKTVFDFLYAKSEHKDDIKVFKNNDDTRFIIKGKNIVIQYDVLYGAIN